MEGHAKLSGVRGEIFPWDGVLIDANHISIILSSVSECHAIMKIAMEKACRCGTGVATIAKRGSGIYTKSYALQYRGNKWDIAAFCTGIGC